MGSYQRALLRYVVLVRRISGFPWTLSRTDTQAMAIILPRVQQHYSVPDSYIGRLPSAMFAGTMFEAVGWGTCSDILGRSAAFDATLFTVVCGFFASFANGFGMLCFALFLLGSAVGGPMPTDGTLLEHMLKEKRYLVTALSVFFSSSSILSAFVALLVLPGNSCSNSRWKYLLVTLATITLSMFLARIVFFRLPESPRYLVYAGRPHEAVKSLQMISKFNGSDLKIELDDVADHRPP
ncbi:MFS general substrate transporter [Macrolepiota fuliginosa MF-IS2]|uniref:MFS general substrate transporter n=1 Tax=Macrolepiota fuliginosa MF-IS2 TaxID=1400762 RepID=A0A9P5WY88_9AGAR|nr:MFS general substrate transporter [Macrolepiota fuliginosa MF-IS2]